MQFSIFVGAAGGGGGKERGWSAHILLYSTTNIKSNPPYNTPLSNIISEVHDSPNFGQMYTKNITNYAVSL